VLDTRRVALDPTQDGRVSERNAAIRHHDHQVSELNLILVYQLTQRMMICLSKCRPLNSASTETNRHILP
jgi:hypothetical protein